MAQIKTEKFQTNEFTVHVSLQNDTWYKGAVALHPSGDFYVITIDSRRSESQINSTLVHEVCHLVQRVLNGRRAPIGMEIPQSHQKWWDETKYPKYCTLDGGCDATTRALELEATFMQRRKGGLEKTMQLLNGEITVKEYAKWAKRKVRPKQTE